MVAALAAAHTRSAVVCGVTVSLLRSVRETPAAVPPGWLVAVTASARGLSTLSTSRGTTSVRSSG
jgi:hypothetical protein